MWDLTSEGGIYDEECNLLDVLSFCIVEVCRRFRETYCHHLQVQRERYWNNSKKWKAYALRSIGVLKNRSTSFFRIEERSKQITSKKERNAELYQRFGGTYCIYSIEAWASKGSGKMQGVSGVVPLKRRRVSTGLHAVTNQKWNMSLYRNSDWICRAVENSCEQISESSQKVRNFLFSWDITF
jgi:hypothetical protein